MVYGEQHEVTVGAVDIRRGVESFRGDLVEHRADDFEPDTVAQPADRDGRQEQVAGAVGKDAQASGLRVGAAEKARDRLAERMETIAVQPATGELLCRGT